jgi:hypothetical protein
VVKSPASTVGRGHPGNPVGGPEAKRRALIAGEEEQLVVRDRATQRPAELVAQQPIVLALAIGADAGKRAVRVEPPVAQELECVAVEPIGARFRDGVHRRCRVHPVLSG